MEQVDHHIQRKVLERLATHDHIRFRDLKPDGIENNIFTYHLQNLIRQGLVTKDHDGYTLAENGLTYVDQLSFTDLRPRLQPKVITILIVQTKDAVALLQRHAQPYIHAYMLPSGKLHFGESHATHAERELHEKLGLVGTPTLRGVATIAISKQKTITQVVAHVFASTFDLQTAITCSDKRFTAQWIAKKDLPRLSLLPGTQQLIDEVNMHEELFIKDFAFDLPL